jgi:isoleucyl-tRNA synthetase
MSKSKGNVVIPSEVINQFGADALRLYLFTMSQAGDPKNFDFNGVDEVVKKTLLIFWNVVTFCTTYIPKKHYSVAPQKPENFLDRWILSRFAEVSTQVTDKLNTYDPTVTGRALQDFVTDLSTWYLRQSRSRLRPGDSFSPAAASTLVYIVRNTSVLFAPFIPFLSEKVFQVFRQPDDPISVHLMPWPDKQKVEPKVLGEMQIVRDIVELTLALRKEKNIKIRQPLQGIAVNQKLTEQQRQLLCAELNILEVDIDELVNAKDLKFLHSARWVQKHNGKLQVALDTEISEDLQHRGLVRELARHVNDLRKAGGFSVQDAVIVEWQTEDNVLKHAFTEHAPELRDLIRSHAIREGAVDNVTCKKELLLGQARVTIGIRKP